MLFDSIGLRIRDARKLARKTLREIGESASLSSAMLSEIETGKKRPSLGSLERIARALGVATADLLTPVAKPRRNHKSNRTAE